MRTEVAVEIRAEPATVFDLARGITRWPVLLPHYRSVTIRSRVGARVVAAMRAVRSFGPIAIPVAWVSEQWADDSDPEDLCLRFVHVHGPTRGMDVTWHIRATDSGCRTTIEHDFSRRFPIVGANAFPRLVDRLFVRPIAGRTLATFKTLAEKETG
jgi:ribosome-associated toxin RatA of RatAB toxin-antitoxin module